MASTGPASEQDAGALQGIGSVQGSIHSAPSKAYSGAREAPAWLEPGGEIPPGSNYSGQTIRISGIATAITTRVSGSPSVQ